MITLLLLPFILLLVFLLLRMHSAKYLPFLLGILVFVLVLFLKSNHILSPITDIGNLLITILTIAVASTLYIVYYKKLGSK